jgi:hypothetical protein
MSMSNLLARYQHDRTSGVFSVDGQDILNAGSVDAALEYVRQCAIEQGLQDASVYLDYEEATRLQIAEIFEEHGKSLLAQLLL